MADESFAERFAAIAGGGEPKPMEPVVVQPRTTEVEPQPQVGPTGGGVSPSIEERLTQVSEQAIQAKLMAQLAADPAISEVMRRRQAGEPIEFAKPQAPQETRLEPLPEDAKPQDIVQHMEKMFEGVVNKTLAKAIEPLNQKLQKVEQADFQRRAAEAEQQIQRVSEKFPDLASYAPQMQQLANQNPGLNVEELYLIAKTRAGKPLVTDRSTETERPSVSASRVPSGGPPKVGVRGFRDILAQAARERS